MQQKPYRWNVSPALIAPNARDLWRGVAFVAPLWGGTGKGALLNSRGQPLAGANLVAGSTLQWRGTPFGAGVGISGASNLLTQSNFAPIVTSNGVGTGDFTLVCLTDPKAEARASTLLGQRQAASPYNWGLLFLNSDIFGNQVSGQLSFSTQESGAANVSANVPGVIDGTMHMFGGVRRSGQMRAYVDGGLRATATGAAQNIYTASHGFAIGNLPPDASAYRIATDTEVVFAAGWNRALSDAEMRLLARDPFCMFRPAAEWRGVWTALGFSIAKAVAWRVMGRAAKSSAWRVFARSAKATTWRVFARAGKTSVWRIFTRASKSASWRVFARAGKTSVWRIFTRASKSASWRVFARAARATAWSILNTLQAARAVSWRIMGRASKPASWRILTRAAKSSAWRVFTRASKASAWRIFTRSAKAASWRVFARNARATAWRVFTRTGKTSTWRIFTRAVKPASWRIAGRKAVTAAWRILTRAARAAAWRIGAAPTVAADVHLNAAPHARHLKAAPHVRTIFARSPKR